MNDSRTIPSMVMETNSSINVKPLLFFTIFVRFTPTPAFNLPNFIIQYLIVETC